MTRRLVTVCLLLASAMGPACDDRTTDGPLPEVRGALIDEAPVTAAADHVEEAVAAETPPDGEEVAQAVVSTPVAPEPIPSTASAPAVPEVASPIASDDALDGPADVVSPAVASAEITTDVTTDDSLDLAPDVSVDVVAESAAAVAIESSDEVVIEAEPLASPAEPLDVADVADVADDTSADSVALGVAAAPPPPPVGAEPETPRPFPFADDDVAQPLSWDDLDVPDDHIPMPWPVDGVEPDPVRYPADVAALDGTLVAVEGFVIPTVDWGKELRRFAISVDPPGCCFGQASALDRWIEVELIDDAEALEYSYWAVARIEGELIVTEHRNPYGYIESMYQLRARTAVTID